LPVRLDETPLPPLLARADQRLALGGDRATVRRALAARHERPGWNGSRSTAASTVCEPRFSRSSRSQLSAAAASEKTAAPEHNRDS
jgi:hypothetical protein